MVNQLRDLLRESSAGAPHDDSDLAAVLRAGRRRVRGRRAGALGGTALAAVAVVGAVALLRPQPVPIEAGDGVVPAPAGPVLRLSDAEQAVSGQDYRVVASYTNDDLERDNGQYFDGVTDDGLILFRDGPRMNQLQPRYALMDPATGEKDWLPDLDTGQAQTWPLELGAERLVLLGAEGGVEMHLVAHVFDRDRREWSAVRWPDLPAVEDPFGMAIGPDGRLYVPVPATHGQPPPGGWPTGPDGEADDADAEGDTYRLWSASLSDVHDVRDEGLTVGSIAFSGDDLVYTDATNGDAGLVHVRDLATGRERTFDPHTGERCNLLSFGATADRVMMSQYCGTYRVDEGAIRDDRVQILSTDGDQVATLQDNGVEGALESGSDVVSITSYDSVAPGNYAFDLGTDRFLRLSDDVSSWTMGGPTRPGQWMWTTPANGRKGATQWIGELAGRP